MTARQRRICGPGSLSELGPLLRDLGATRVFLVTGVRSFTRSGARELLEPQLEGGAVTRLSCSARVPNLDDVREGRRRFRAEESDLVLAVGGGKVIDMAKLIGAGRRPMIAVPTTAGSGSEATRFAAIYIRGVKRSADHEALRPDWAIVDARLTLGMPAETAAASGFDALAQAIESSWSVRSTPESQRLSHRAISLAAAHLRPSVRGAPESRAAMAEAAHLAGRAIDRTRTTAAHALSYGLTWTHGIPHGHAVALTLSSLFAFNAGVTDADCCDPRGAAYVRGSIDALCGLLGCAGPSEVRRFLHRLMIDCGLTPYTRELGLGSAELDAVVEGVDGARLGNNPRALGTRATLAALFETDPPSRGDTP